MSLSSKLAFQFDRGVQIRGSEIFADDAVRAIDVEPNHFHGMVKGGRVYEVCLQYKHAGTLTVSCQCPYFDDRGACKHLWAAVLEADRRGALSAAAHERYLNVMEVDPDDDAERPFVLSAPKAKNLPPAWEADLTVIQRSLETYQPTPSPNWPHEFELLYVFNLASSRSSGATVIEVLSRARKKTGDWSVPKVVRLITKQL